MGFSPRFVAIGLLSLALSAVTAWLFDIPNRQLIALVLLAWFVGLYVAAEIWDRLRSH